MGRKDSMSESTSHAVARAAPCLGQDRWFICFAGPGQTAAGMREGTQSAEKAEKAE